MAEFADELPKLCAGMLTRFWWLVTRRARISACRYWPILIRAGRVPKDGPALAFLTLGQVVPMVSFLPEAYRLRADLRYLSARDELTWVDVTAPGDGCAFALCDPVTVAAWPQGQEMAAGVFRRLYPDA